MKSIKNILKEWLTMKGNTIKEFMNDIYSTGGPEKEFLYKGKEYMLQCEYNFEAGFTEIIVFECFGDNNIILRCQGKTIRECAEQFEQSKIFDGKTIYEAEKDIEVLFG